MTAKVMGAFSVTDSSIQNLGDRRRATRVKILKGASTVFASRGLEQTTVEQILRASGVSRRTFYQCFPDKHAVLLAIYERSTAHLMSERRKAMTCTGSGLERLRRGQQVYFDFISTSGSLIQVLAAEALRPSSPLARRRLWLHDGIEALYRDTYREAEAEDLDALAVRSLILHTEALSLYVLQHHPGDAAIFNQSRALLGRHLEALVASARPITESSK